MKKVLVCVSLILIVAGAACKKQEPQQPQGAPQGQLQDQNEIRMLREALRRDPKNTDAWIKLGNTLMDNSQFSEAIDSYQKALELDPKNVDVRVDMGICYRNSGKPAVAVSEFRKAIETNPSHLMAHKNLAVVLEYDMADKAGAIKEFEKTLELAPNAADAERIKAEIRKLKEQKG